MVSLYLEYWGLWLGDIRGRGEGDREDILRKVHQGLVRVGIESEWFQMSVDLPHLISIASCLCLECGEGSLEPSSDRVEESPVSRSVRK